MKYKIYLMILIPFIVNAQTFLTVQDAIRVGLKNNFDIQIARKSAEISLNTAKLGTSGFLPNIDISGNTSISKSEQETNSPFSFGNSTTNSWGGQVALNWTLFDGFKMFVDNVRYKELAKLGEFQAKSIIESSVIGIAQSYYNLVLQEKLYDITLTTLQISKDRLDKAGIRNELGGASSTDLLNAQVSYNSDKSELLQRKLQVIIAKKNLNISLGRSPEDSIEVAKEITVAGLEYEFNDLKAAALNNSSDLLIAQQNKIIAANNLSISQSNYYPRLILNGVYGYSDRTVASDSPRFSGDVTTKSTDGSIGLSISFNIFNGFKNSIEIQSAQIQDDLQKITLQKVETELLGSIKEKYDTYKTQLDFIKLEEENVKAAEQNLNLQNERYQTGTTTSLEFRDAQLNYSRALNALVTAKYNAAITQLEILRLTGGIQMD
ncbi:MAG: TolC family protein [Melioribacteraceae bacterium]|nr:TolC family protein [Melioribacteraceae bacterium]